MHRSATLATLTLALAGCQPTHHARLDDGAGLTEGSPVLVSSVRVGHVKSVRVVEANVDVEFEIDDEHQVTLRTDSCALARHADGQREAALILMLGTGAMREGEAPIAQCRIELGAEAGQLMRQLGEGIGGVLRQFGRGLFGGTPSDPSHPSSPQAPPSAPQPPPSQPFAPLPTVRTQAEACEAVRIRVDRIERVEAIPVLLPSGGYRLFLEFANNNDVPMEIGGATDASFIERNGHAHTGVATPTDATDWFMPFTVPANAFRRVSVVIASDSQPLMLREIGAVALSPGFLSCTVREQFSPSPR